MKVAFLSRHVGTILVKSVSVKNSQGLLQIASMLRTLCTQNEALKLFRFAVNRFLNKRLRNI